MKTAQGLIHQSPALRKRAGAEERKTGRSGRQWDVEAEMGQAWNVVWKEQERMMEAPRPLARGAALVLGGVCRRKEAIQGRW